MSVRQVITGHDANGKSVFVRDEEIEPVTLQLMPGAQFHQLWGTDEVPTVPAGEPRPSYKGYFPRAEGFRFYFVTLPPSTVVAPENIDFDAALREVSEKLPGLTDVMEPDHPGFHTTDTVDFEVVLSGEVVLELDDGAEVTLKPGDTVVQNGTRHAWHNRGDVPAVFAVAIVGAQRT